MSGSNKQPKAGVEDSTNPITHPLGSTAGHDVRRDLTNLTSQMQMMSDSLAACKQMSKGRPLRKMYSVKGSARTDVTEPQDSMQALLSSEEKATGSGVDQEGHSVIVSYMMDAQRLKKTESDETDSCRKQSCSWRRGSCNSATEESLELLKGSSKIQMYEHEEVDSSRMIDIIQRELRELMEMAPSVTLVAIALSDTIFHYKECNRCSEKISPSLPFILSRIQKLIKYVTIRREGTYNWPNDYSYLRLRPPTRPHSPRLSGRLLAKLEKVNPTWITEQIPGLQLLLEVTPDITHKKLFDKAENCSAATWGSALNFSVVHLREPKSVPLVQVLVPTRDPDLLLDEKRETLVLREFAWAAPLVPTIRLNPLTLFLLPTPVASLTRTPKPLFPSRPRVAYRTSSQEHPVHSRKKNPKGTPQGQFRGGERTIRHTEGLPKRSNDKQPFSTKELLARVPEIVREFLQEAEAEKMHDQKVRNLETGAKGLRDLVSEVQMNQMELSKALMEKGIYPQPIIKLTDPDMLEKENDIIKRVAELLAPGSKRTSVEALQAAVDDVKHKCTLKNRMILVILKGLRSNIPNEWWEDMVEYVFDESKSIEDFDPEKVNEIVQRAMIIPRHQEQAPRPQARILRPEDRPTEEETKMKGIVGADVEEYLNKRWKDNGMVAKTEVTSVCDPEGFFERNLKNPVSADTSFRKLEKQVSVLNTDNERLRHEVEELKNLLRNSVNDFGERTASQPSPRPVGKTINLTIQIVDKDFHRMNDPVTLSHNSTADGLRERRVGPTIKWKDADSLSDLGESKAKEGEQTILPDSRCSSNNLGSVLRESAFEQSPHRLPPKTGQEVFRKSKPLAWVPSKYRIPEVSDESGAGPSPKPIETGHLFQKPSVMKLVESHSPGMSASMANDRELQTIPENDCSTPSKPPKGLSQTIQRLRTRVRSIHKDVAVLKSKNDRIEKLLDRLMDDAFENGESFEEMENSFLSLKEQLG